MDRHHTAALVCLLLATGLLPVSTLAGGAATTDGVAMFSFQPPAVEMAPGETTQVSVVLRSTPQFANGAYKAGFVVTFNRTALAVRNVSRGPFMSLRRNTTVRRNQSRIDNENGFVLYELVREPPNGGVSGFARFAVLTITAREDAPNGSYPLEFFRARILLTDGNSQRVVRRSGEVVVNRTGPVGAATTATTTTPQPTTTAGGADGTTRTTASGGSGSGDGSPGGGSGGLSGPVVGAVALLATMGLLVGVFVLLQRA